MEVVPKLSGMIFAKKIVKRCSCCVKNLQNKIGGHCFCFKCNGVYLNPCQFSVATKVTMRVQGLIG